MGLLCAYRACALLVGFWRLLSWRACWHRDMCRCVLRVLAAQGIFQRLGGGLVAAFEGMGVDRCCNRRRRMPQSSSDGSERDALGDHQASGQVPHVMPTDYWES